MIIEYSVVFQANVFYKHNSHRYLGQTNIQKCLHCWHRDDCGAVTIGHDILVILDISGPGLELRTSNH